MITLTILFVIMILAVEAIAISFSVAFFLAKIILAAVPLYLLIKIFFPRRIC